MRSKRGIIGIVSLFLMFSLLLFGLAVSLAMKSQFRNSTFRGDELKALYIAEAGIERAIWRLTQDPEWREGYQDEAVIFEGGEVGRYSVCVEEKGEDELLLTARGWLRAEKRLRVLVKLVPLSPLDVFSDYALFWGNTDETGSLSLVNSVQVTRSGKASGDVFANGDIFINQASSVSPGLVYATGTVGGDGDYTPGGVPSPIPSFPHLETTYYDEEINIASAQPPGDWILMGPNIYYLGGSSRYINGNVFIQNTAHIVGPGKIVATGDINIRNSTVTQDVEIIAGGKLSVENSAQVLGENLLYSAVYISLRNSVVVEGVVITPSNIEILNSARVEGIVYAEGETFLRNSALIIGSIVSNEFTGGQITNSVDIVHDLSPLPEQPPPGLTGGEGRKVKVVRWEELPL